MVTDLEILIAGAIPGGTRSGATYRQVGFASLKYLLRYLGGEVAHCADESDRMNCTVWNRVFGAFADLAKQDNLLARARKIGEI